MIRKRNAARLLGATMISFVLVSAFTPGAMREPAPGDLPDVTERVEAPHPLRPFEDTLLNTSRLTPVSPLEIDSETLWLARAIYSETKRPEEQILVAWVIRNRVETAFRGKRTYKDVVLDPYQFSAFLTNSSERPFYLSLKPSSSAPGWQRTLHIAYSIRHLNGNYRPFSPRTRHFYSERSMKEGLAPTWVEGRMPLDMAPILTIDQKRFRFYEGIS